MKKILRYTAAFALATAAAIFVGGYATTTTDNSRESNVERNVESPSSRWRIVRQVFQLHIPQNNSPLSQLIIDTPSTVSVSNDIDVRDEDGQKININIFANGRRIIIELPEKTVVNTKLLIEFNNVRQPIQRSGFIYRFFVKVVGSDTEISIGEARFITF